MYALVCKFYYDVHYVCRSSHIYTNKQDITTVKYSNQCKYLATIIAKNDTDKLITLHDISANNETAISKSDFDYQKNAHVSVHENITTTIKCDNGSANNDTYNINCNCPRNIPAPYVNINKTRCYDDVMTRSKNKKTNISNSDSNCQRNVHVPASCVKTNKTVICNDTNNNETDISNPEHSCQKNVRVLASNNDETDICNAEHNCKKNVRVPASNNDETDISNPEHNCQRNVHVSTSCSEYSLISKCSCKYRLL